MNILYLNEINEGRDGVSSTESIDVGGQYMRIFLVETDTPTYNAQEIILATCATGTIPAMGSAYPTDGNSVVVQITARPRADLQYWWEVSCHYDVTGSPTADHPYVHWSGVNYQKPMTKDIRSFNGTATATYTDLVIGSGTDTNQLSSGSRPFVSGDVGSLILITSGTNFFLGFYLIVSVAGGVATLDRQVGLAAASGGNATLGISYSEPFPAITNSAGDPYDPPQMKDDTRDEVTITRNFTFTGFTWATAQQFKDAVNIAAITLEDVTCSARTLKVMHIDRELMYRNSAKYWKVTARIQYDPLTWDAALLDQGYREYIAANTNWRAIFGMYGETHGKPALLDGNGLKLVKGHPPAYRIFQVYNPVDFSMLNLSY